MVRPIQYKNGKVKALKFLGGVCVSCRTSKKLQIDHINHKNKNFEILPNITCRWEVIVEELKLCQLLCAPCHLAKSKAEGSLSTAKFKPIKHGSRNAYSHRGCRCVVCKKQHSIRNRNSYLKRKARGALV